MRSLNVLSRSLNPYCSGQWSRTLQRVSGQWAQRVLILIVVDNGLVLVTSQVCLWGTLVLILIVVDNGLVLGCILIKFEDEKSVLILIVVDNGLVPELDGTEGDLDNLS